MEILTKTHTYTLSGLNGTQTQVSEYMIKKLGYLERDDIHQDVVDKLGKLEDLMELYHCNSIDDLKNRLECLEKLKEYCKEQCRYYHLDYWDDRYGSMESAHKRILEKIEELEPKGDE